MSKKLQKLKKFLSGAAASMMIFGATPKSNTKALNKDKSEIATTCFVGTGLVALAVSVGIAYNFEKIAWKKELNKRDDLISKTNDYIKNLAHNLKEVIPRHNSNLFENLVKCENCTNLRNWQVQVYNCDDLSAEALSKIINCLHTHWRTYFVNFGTAANSADNEVNLLRDKCNRLVSEKRWKEYMKLEKEKLNIAKSSKSIPLTILTEREIRKINN